MEQFKVDPAWSDKDSRIPKFRELYERHDFLTAYAAHTDLRVQADPHQAIGGEWESHGILQRDFLIAQGLKPHHALLDLGCGTGRLARKIVPYLETGCYTGVDISLMALAYAKQTAIDEGWSDLEPDFIHIDGTLSELDGYEYDFIWGHSVLTHLPPEAIDALVCTLNSVMSHRCRFMFTFKRGTKAERTGLKQWRYDDETLASIARQNGFKFQHLDKPVWPSSQRTGMMTRL